MEINLETIQDIRLFKNDWSKFYKNNQALDNVNTAKVVISAKLLSDYLTEEESKLEKAYAELNVLKYNLVASWLEDNLEVIEDESEEEIRKNCLKSVKEELANLKSDLANNTLEITNSKYNFVYMVYDCYNLKPEAIVKKIEKDLSEFEVPVNEVEESVEIES